VAEGVFAGRRTLEASRNDYDWLGDGVYFWEHNAARAYEFACEIRDRPRHSKQRIRQPAVVGAVIDLGYCLNLLDTRSIEMVRLAHDALVTFHAAAGNPLPRNVGPDRLVRKLDCAVLRFLHQSREAAGNEPFDTVRAAFMEGGPLYETAGFSAKTHIQICVRNVACIKGYFRPLSEDALALQ
jgi:hypothetical protein